MRGGNISEFKRRINLEVLNVQPCPRTRPAGSQQCLGCAEKRRLYRQHQVGMPSRLPQHDWQTAKRKTSEMKQSFYTIWTLWHPDWASADLHLFCLRDKRSPKHWPWSCRQGKLLPVVSPCAVSRRDTPLRVMRRRCHDPDFVASGREPSGHLTRVFSSPNRFGMKINAMD